MRVTAKLLSVCVAELVVATAFVGLVCVDFSSNDRIGAGISGNGISGEFELSEGDVSVPVKEGDLGSPRSGSTG